MSYVKGSMREADAVVAIVDVSQPDRQEIVLEMVQPPPAPAETPPMLVVLNKADKMSEEDVEYWEVRLHCISSHICLQGRCRDRPGRTACLLAWTHANNRYAVLNTRCTHTTEQEATTGIILATGHTPDCSKLVCILQTMVRSPLQPQQTHWTISLSCTRTVLPASISTLPLQCVK